MPGIFSRIIAGEVPSFKIAESASCYAFLDISPLKRGHTLVVPRRETDLLFDLPEDEYNSLMLFSKKIAVAMRSVIPCKRIGMVVAGLEVPHAHIHLIPMDEISDLNFQNAKPVFSKEEFASTAEIIRKSFLSLPE